VIVRRNIVMVRWNIVMVRWNIVIVRWNEWAALDVVASPYLPSVDC
jgi:hypothetical protein